MARNGSADHAGVSTLPPRAPNEEVPRNAKGTLLVIGGNENKEGHRPILSELARRAGAGKLAVVTLASEEPEQQWQEYSGIFSELGVKRLVQLDARGREDLIGEAHAQDLEGSDVIFFAGGDQLKITSKLGGTHL